MWKPILGMIIGLGIGALATPVSAAYCTQFSPFPPGCTVWAPTAPSGWTSTGGDNNAYPNEVVICSEYHMKGHCFYRVIPAGAEVGSATLGDMDLYPTQPGWRIQSIKTNLSRGATIYDGQNYTGATHELGGVYYIWGLNIFQTSSIKMRN